MTENDVNPPINNDPMEKRNEFIDHPSYFDKQQKKMMSIAYIYLILYLEINEPFDITANIEAEKELHADFLLEADQIVENHGLF